jgi:hypothetical protein
MRNSSLSRQRRFEYFGNHAAGDIDERENKQAHNPRKSEKDAAVGCPVEE